MTRILASAWLLAAVGCEDSAGETGATTSAPTDTTVTEVDSDTNTALPDSTVDTDLADTLPDSETMPADTLSAACDAWDACVAAECATFGDDLTAAALCGIETCKADWESCHGAFGTATCATAYACTQSCSPGDQACVDGCGADTSFADHVALLEHVVCMNASCISHLQAGNLIAFQLCNVQDCRASYDACNGAWGTGQCKDVLKCSEACAADDTVCAVGCMAEGSYDSSVDFMKLGLCISENCPAALAEPLAHLDCFIGPCSAPMTTCCGGLTGCL
ncbi:MAG: hypothetical protein ACI9MR_002661 [Myxococcota bacterium]|jgi:hypothetical protein